MMQLLLPARKEFEAGSLNVGKHKIFRFYADQCTWKRVQVSRVRAPRAGWWACYKGRGSQ